METFILRANISHAKPLAQLSAQTFWESHGTSASVDDIQNFINKTYSESIYHLELQDAKNKFFVVEHNKQLIGYSKIAPNQAHSLIKFENITKLDRFYLLEKYYGKGIGQLLFFNIIETIKSMNQAGIWLHVWKNNKRALKFYEKMGFVNVGNYDFQLSPTHSNPNFVMFYQL